MMTHVMLFLLIVGKAKIAQDAFMILMNSLLPPTPNVLLCDSGRGICNFKSAF
jgi:hypothetical protein